MFERAIKRFLEIVFLVPKEILLKLLWVYKALVSPFLGNNCKYKESCSSYAKRQLEETSFLIAMYRVIRRVLSCNGYSKPFDGEVVHVLDDLIGDFNETDTIHRQ